MLCRWESRAVGKVLQVLDRPFRPLSALCSLEQLGFNALLQLMIGVPLEMVHGILRISLLYMAGVLAGEDPLKCIFHSARSNDRKPKIIMLQIRLGKITVPVIYIDVQFLILVIWQPAGCVRPHD